MRRTQRSGLQGGEALWAAELQVGETLYADPPFSCR